MEYVRLSRATAGDYRRKVLFDVSWVWAEGEVWAVTGANGAGKSALAALLTGELLVYEGQTTMDPGLCVESWIGFEPQKRLLESERRADLSDVSERPDAGTTALAFVGSTDLLAQLGLIGKENRGLKQMSTGELRRACLARAWKQPFWILDEPYEGLDAESRELLSFRIQERLVERKPVLFLSRRPSDFPPGVTHVWELNEGRTVFQGPFLAWVARVDSRTSSPVFEVTGQPALSNEKNKDEKRSYRDPILEFAGVTAGYSDVEVLTNFSWTVYPGERWLVRGPNGSGKSTLLSLISGEHPQAFQPGLKIFGKHRGGDLTWAELHRRSSHLSYLVHQRFRDLWFTPLAEVVIAGFQDAVRLVSQPSWDQVAASRSLLNSLGLSSVADKLWEDLSWGEQRLALLARALVKDPELLLLDEPCQGLDDFAQERFQNALVDEVGERGTTVLYVTHRNEERPFGDFRLLELPVRADRTI